MNTAILEQEILNGFPDPVIMLNTRREIVGRNTAARELLGTGPMGRDLSLSLRHPAILAAADAVLAGKKPAPAQVSIPLSVPREFTLHVSPLSADGGGDGGAMLVFHDVTAAKTAEKMRADFVANVSHELRSPLASLVGFIETLRGPAKGDEEARERFLGIMENEAGRMTRLIDDLLSLSRVEAGEFIRPEGTIDLKTLLKVISDSLSVRAEERKMSIRLEFPEGISSVKGDQDELNKVFQNLMDNAINYGRKGTEVQVRVELVDRIPDSGVPGVAVSVANQGDGIAPEHLPRLTERFYRVDKGRSRSVGGTGLGLAIVKHVVNRHRGRLKIESTLGKGSTFTVFLPANGKQR